MTKIKMTDSVTNCTPKSNFGQRIFSLKIVAALFISIIFSLQTKAQADDPMLGIYVDGVKVNELNCYSFKKMTLVFPYNSSYNLFNKVVVGMYSSYKKEGLIWNGLTYKEIIPATLFKYVKGKYLIYEIFKEGEQRATGDGSVTRSGMQYVTMHDGPNLMIRMEGMTISGYQEYYDAGCQCYKKNPTYDTEELYTSQIPLNNRIKFKSLFKAPPEVDLSQPCVAEGKKIDFNSLDAGSSTQNSNDETATSNKPTSGTKSNTGGTGNRTIITTNAPTNATAVKPLDKTKSGYFAEKSEDKKFLYREGYQSSPGTYHGEVREYDNNKLDKIVVYSNGQEDGLYVSFDSNGKVEWSGAYKNGKKEGTWKKYKDGQVDVTKKYFDGEEQD